MNCIKIDSIKTDQLEIYLERERLFIPSEHLNTAFFLHFIFSLCLYLSAFLCLLSLSFPNGYNLNIFPYRTGK